MTDSYPAQAVDGYLTLGRSFHIRWSIDALEVRPFNQNKNQTGPTNMNKNATSTISSASGVLAADELRLKIENKRHILNKIKAGKMEILVFALIATRKGYIQHETFVPEVEEFLAIRLATAKTSL